MATMEKRKIEYIKIEKLRHYERNTRTHNDAQLNQIIASINEFGFTNPVLIDESNVLIAGHGRTTAAQMMGLKEVPAIRLNGLSEPQKKALRIADNKLALNAGWDEELLKLELGDLQELDYDLDLVGFDLTEIDALLQDVGGFDEPIISPPAARDTTAARPEYTQVNTTPDYNETGSVDSTSPPRGITYKANYAIIVVCGDEREQEETYNTLTSQGYTCKVLVN